MKLSVSRRVSATRLAAGQGHTEARSFSCAAPESGLAPAPALKLSVSRRVSATRLAAGQGRTEARSFSCAAPESGFAPAPAMRLSVSRRTSATRLAAGRGRSEVRPLAAGCGDADPLPLSAYKGPGGSPPPGPGKFAVGGRPGQEPARSRGRRRAGDQGEMGPGTGPALPTYHHRESAPGTGSGPGLIMKAGESGSLPASR